MTGRPRILLRDMTERDLRAVRRVEKAAYTDAWSRRMFENELRNAFARYLVVTESTAGSTDDAPAAGVRRSWVRRLFGGPTGPAVIGFVGAWFMRDQLHVATIAVDPARQGEGIGARLLLLCFELADESGLTMLVLELRVSNARARALYERYGFTIAGRLAGYYTDDGEDALVMTTPALDDPAMRARIASLGARHRERYPWLWSDDDEPDGGDGPPARSHDRHTGS